MTFAPLWRLGERVGILPSHTFRDWAVAQVTKASEDEYGQAKINCSFYGDKNEGNSSIISRVYQSTNTMS